MGCLSAAVSLPAGCMSVKVADVPPSVSAKAEAVGGLVMGVADAAFHAEVTTMATNHIKATAKGVNVAINVTAWLACNTGLNEEYLAVTDGLLMTIDDGYLTVRRM